MQSGCSLKCVYSTPNVVKKRKENNLYPLCYITVTKLARFWEQCFDHSLDKFRMPAEKSLHSMNSLHYTVNGQEQGKAALMKKSAESSAMDHLATRGCFKCSGASELNA